MGDTTLYLDRLQPIEPALLRELRNPPGRRARPPLELVGGPGGGLVLMARGAGVRHPILVRHRGRDEPEGVGADERAGHAFAFDLRHMAGHALAAAAAVFVVGVLLQSRFMRSVW